MGAVFRSDEETGEHVSTGKFPHPEGVRHDPHWGQWWHEWAGIWARYCVADDCDITDYTDENPT